MASNPTVYKASSSLRSACERGTGLPIKSISLSFKPSDMIDDTSTGLSISFPASALPAQCFVLGWKCVSTVGFAGDTSAQIQVGITGTIGLYSSVTNGDIFTATTVGSVADGTTGILWQAAAATPLVTIISATNATLMITSNVGRATVTIYYLPLP